jgi:hypothetical protein
VHRARLYHGASRAHAPPEPLFPWLTGVVAALISAAGEGAGELLDDLSDAECPGGSSPPPPFAPCD